MNLDIGQRLKDLLDSIPVGQGALNTSLPGNSRAAILDAGLNNLGTVASFLPGSTPSDMPGPTATVPVGSTMAALQKFIDAGDDATKVEARRLGGFTVPPARPDGWINGDEAWVPDPGSNQGHHEIAADALRQILGDKGTFANDAEWQGKLPAIMAQRDYPDKFQSVFYPWERMSDLGYARYTYQPHDQSFRFKLTPNNLDDPSLMQRVYNIISKPSMRNNSHSLVEMSTSDPVNDPATEKSVYPALDSLEDIMKMFGR